MTYGTIIISGFQGQEHDFQVGSQVVVLGRQVLEVWRLNSTSGQIQIIWIQPDVELRRQTSPNPINSIKGVSVIGFFLGLWFQQSTKTTCVTLAPASYFVERRDFGQSSTNFGSKSFANDGYINSTYSSDFLKQESMLLQGNRAMPKLFFSACMAFNVIELRFWHQLKGRMRLPIGHPY